MTVFSTDYFYICRKPIGYMCVGLFHWYVYLTHGYHNVFTHSFTVNLRST